MPGVCSWACGGLPTCREAVESDLCMRMATQDIIFMLSANLFRALPPSRGADQENYDPDEEEPTLEPTWPHLQVCWHVAAPSPYWALNVGEVWPVPVSAWTDLPALPRWASAFSAGRLVARWRHLHSARRARISHMTVWHLQQDVLTPCVVVAMQIVYEFLLRYVVCQDTDAKAAKKYIDQVGFLSVCSM